MSMRRPVLALGLLVVALGLLTGAVLASPEAQVGEQWKTAVTHAKLSQNYSGTKEITQHLQHVVNCIEGARSPRFDGAQGNPCQGQGNGMMVDAKPMGGKYGQASAYMSVASDIAVSGVKSGNADKAKAAAWATQLVLERAGEILR